MKRINHQFYTRYLDKDAPYLSPFQKNLNQIIFYFISISLIILFGTFTSTSSAQGQSPITLQVDRTEVALNETLTLTIVVQSNQTNSLTPTLAALDGFDIVGRNQSSFSSNVNGTITAQTTYHLQLQPKRTGTLEIGPATLILNNQTFTTSIITVEVTPAKPTSTPLPTPTGQAMTPDQAFFVEAEVDQNQPFIGQHVLYTFRLNWLANHRLDSPRYEAPNFGGFWSQDHDDQTQSTTRINGRVYRTVALQSSLFPRKVGQLTISPANLYIRRWPFNPDIFLQTEPITLTVQPLPDSAPADFNDAVGQFELDAEVDVIEGKVNEPVTLKVTLQGIGHLETLPDPIWPDLSGWRAFESDANVSSGFTPEGQLGGSRTYERVLIPETSGDLVIPPIRYPYFDPALVAYKILETEPMTITIAAGEAAPPVPQVIVTQKETIEQIGSDIRHIKQAPVTFSRAAIDLTATRIYWLAWTVPIFMLTVYFIWQRRQQYHQIHAALIRQAKAYKKALTALNGIQPQSDDAYAALHQIFTTYLSDKLDRPIAGLTQIRLGQVLLEAGLSETLIEQVNDCLTQTELGRFVPEARSAQMAMRLVEKTRNVIELLEVNF